jgi:hypothetical protein
LLLVLLATVSGCRHNHQDLLEAELRTREDEVYHLRQDLARAESFNYSLERVHDPSCAPFAPDAVYTDGPGAAMSGTVREVVLGRGTGGMDERDCPADGGLQVVVVPHDADGSAIKAPGQLHVEAFEVSSEGLKIPLSSWDVPSLQLSKQWRTGLLASGYFVALPWKALPHSEKLRVVMRFTTLPDNRPFEDDRTVTIRIPGALSRPAGPIPIETPPIDSQTNPPFFPKSTPSYPPDRTEMAPIQDGPFFPTASSPKPREPAASLSAPQPAEDPSSKRIQLLRPQLPPE